MRLTEKQSEILLSKLNHLERTACTCGHADWYINDRIFELREFEGGNLIIGGNSSVLPVVSIICKHCGYTLFYSAVSLGLLKGNEETGDRK